MTLELLVRHRTDYTMFYLAGMIGVIFLVINEFLTYDTDYLFQVFICGLCATVGELLVGLLCNQDYQIWDYRNLPFHFMGQIQLYFSILWCAMAACFIPILDYIDYHMFEKNKAKRPYYKILGKTVWVMPV